MLILMGRNCNNCNFNNLKNEERRGKEDAISGRVKEGHIIHIPGLF